MFLRSLGKETVIYGLGSVLGRLINYLIVPLHTYIFVTQASYGVIAEMYSYAAFINVFLAFGLEISVFRFIKNKTSDKLYLSNMMFMISVLSSSFLLLILFNTQNISNFLSLGQASFYSSNIILFWGLILFFDALCVIPFALLRLSNQPKKFITVKLMNISVNILFNLVFLVFLPAYWERSVQTQDIQFVFLANLIASSITFIILFPYLKQLKLGISWRHLTEVLKYSFPIMIAGIFGMVNETLDRIFLKWWLPGNLNENLSDVGIYNANYKLAIFMTIVIQAVRMGMEPFFFKNHSESDEQDAKHRYVLVMDVLTWLCSIVFIFVICLLPYFKFFIGEKYRSGLHIVPILLLANWFLGMYFQNSFWYKVKDKTYWGILFAFIGISITILGNYYLIPIFGIAGSAWTTLFCYFIMLVFSMSIGLKVYPVAYRYVNMILYLSVALILFLIFQNIQTHFSTFTATLICLSMSLVYLLLTGFPKLKLIKYN